MLATSTGPLRNRLGQCVPAPPTSDATDPETLDAGDVTLHRRREFAWEIDPDEHEGIRVHTRVLASRALLTGIQDGRSDGSGTRPTSPASGRTPSGCSTGTGLRLPGRWDSGVYERGRKHGIDGTAFEHTEYASDRGRERSNSY